MFLPVALLGYHLLRKTGSSVFVKLWLAAVSVVFYGLGQPDFLLGFLICGLVNFGIARLLGLQKAKLPRVFLLLAAIFWNIGILFYFKYFNFFLEGLNLFTGTNFGMRNIYLPLGISFFTFQMLAYDISVYRQTAPVMGLLDYSVFITFFPQLIVGPVVKHEEMLPQIEKSELLKFDTVNVYRGVMLFSIGCAKKLLLADPMIVFASGFYSSDVTQASLLTAWCGVLAYTFAYYFDFSGYIDMARGIGHLFGITLPINFDSPYQARNFADFWRRWNITISRFFSESVFNNLFHFGDGLVKLIFATFATFLVSGLWHGADWHYLVWGAANGLLVCVANIMTLYRKSIPVWLAAPLTFFFSALVRVLFDCSGMTQAVQVYRRMFRLDPGLSANLGAFAADNWRILILLIVSAAICFCCKNANRISEQETFTAKDALFSATVLTLAVFRMSEVSGFLYFNF